MPENLIHWHKVIRRDNAPLFQYIIIKSFDNLSTAYGIDAHFHHYRFIKKDIYHDFDELQYIEKTLANMLLVDTQFPLRKYQVIKKLGQQILYFTKSLAKRKKFTKTQKLNLFNKFYQLHLIFDPYFRFTYPYGKIFEERTMFILEYWLAKRGQKNKLEKIFENFVVPFEKPFLSLEREHLSQIALYVSAHGWRKNDATFSALVKKHISTFSFLTFNAGRGEILSEEQIKQETRREARKSTAILKAQTSWFTREKLRSAQLLKELNLGQQFNWSVSMMQRYIFLRLYVKEVVEKSYYDLFNLLSAIGQPYGLGYKDIVYLLPEEINRLIKGQGKEYSALIEKRKRSYAIERKKKSVRLYTGNQVKFLLNNTEQVEIKAVEIKGAVANKGKAKGPVKVVMYSPDCSKIELGDIIVAPMTTPEFVSAMRRAAAIITDEGGITCHAAIVSRELKIPCIIGTKNATKILNDGDIVEVDANKGLIRVL